jgi:ribonucleoside-triphosphate reductase (formate)
MFEKSSINQAVNSVYKSLQSRIIKTYDISDIEEAEEISDKLLKIHGMSKEDFSVIDKIERLITNNLNDESIDDNSNKGEKTIKGIMKESVNPFEKMTGYRFLYRKMAEIYGKKEAKYLTSLMYDYTIALSDSTNILVPYCWAFDASKLVTMGKPFGQLPSSPAKRMDSYISLLNEVAHTMSNHLAGAIAIGTFFLDISHLLLVKERKRFEDLQDKQYRKWIQNQFQKVVHGFNSLSRSGGTESPFTNISIFDREKLNKLIKEEYSWYYMDIVGIETVADNHYIDSDYIVEFIIELQNIFMEFFDKGDPMNDGMPYRFPVVTLNISKKRDKEGKWVIEDKQFLKSACKKDIYRYNIFVSEGNKIASCCRLINSVEMADLASQANSFGAGGSISLGSHRVITVNFVRLALMAKTYDEFFELIEKATNNCKKILYAHKQMLYDLKPAQVFLKIGWIQLERMFSTVGLLGYVEATTIIKDKFNIKDDIMGLMFDKLNDTLNANNEEFKGCFYNLEQIPAESMSHRLARADKLLFGKDKVKYDIYSNQIVPLWETNISLWEKMKITGTYLKKLTGGGIDHENTGEHITAKQAEKIIDYAVECDLEHLAITGTFCQCVDGHVIIGKRDTCAKCGNPIKSKIARVVGFFTPVEDWNENKRIYDHDRRREFINGDFEK